MALTVARDVWNVRVTAWGQRPTSVTSRQGSALVAQGLGVVRVTSANLATTDFPSLDANVRVLSLKKRSF